MRPAVPFLLLALLLLPLEATGEDTLEARVLAAKDRVFPALVHIVNVEEGFALGRRQKSVSTGSGFFVDDLGHIVTNYHVAGEGKLLVVTLASKKEVEAKLVAGDPYTDLAVLRVDPKEAFPDGKPPFATFGDSSRLQEGDFVVAMGSPLSLSRSVSFGIISCRERTLDSLEVAGHETGKYNTWLQTDAAINPGNSGGPLVDLAGEVVGVNTRAALLANNIGFAIPSNVVRDVVEALLREGRVPRSDIGVRLQPLGALEHTLLASSEPGALVAAVDFGSPAAHAGVMPGDVLLALDGEPFAARFEEQLPGLYARIARLKAGTEAKLTLRRGGERMEVPVTPEALGLGLGAETEVAKWGITVRALTPRMRLESGLPDEGGVLVTGVRAGSPAAAKLEDGDILLVVGGTEIRGLAQFLEAIGGAESPLRIAFRRGTVIDVTVLREAR
ncbi:MAG TPA: trypsin-like peptidase domain-containing protein [Planctomycetota bacterium]|nr:trypsin-like peptidase domain-containing protein [Planctomycetota bacterium]